MIQLISLYSFILFDLTYSSHFYMLIFFLLKLPLVSVHSRAGTGKYKFRAGAGKYKLGPESRAGTGDRETQIHLTDRI